MPQCTPSASITLPEFINTVHRMFGRSPVALPDVKSTTDVTHFLGAIGGYGWEDVDYMDMREFDPHTIILPDKLEDHFARKRYRYQLTRSIGHGGKIHVTVCTDLTVCGEITGQWWSADVRFYNLPSRPRYPTQHVEDYGARYWYGVDHDKGGCRMIRMEPLPGVVALAISIAPWQAAIVPRVGLFSQITRLKDSDVGQALRILLELLSKRRFTSNQDEVCRLFTTFDIE